MVKHGQIGYQVFWHNLFSYALKINCFSEKQHFSLRKKGTLVQQLSKERKFPCQEQDREVCWLHRVLDGERKSLATNNSSLIFNRAVLMKNN